MDAVRAAAVSTGMAMALMIAACSSSTPSTPSQPSTANQPQPQLIISGPTTLRVGLTSQLTAALSNGAAVTGVTWRTDSTAIATVSPDGVLTAVSVGGTKVTATAAGATVSAAVTVQPAGTTTVTITACSAITGPGQYVLGIELRVNCFVSSVADFQLDCASHGIGALLLNNVNTATIRNCSIIGNLQLTDTTNVTVTNSSVFGGTVLFLRTTNTTFASNTVTHPDPGSAVSLGRGSNNKILNNTLAGGYDGGPAYNGTDDGIILADESNDLVQGNTISDFYDAGVEGLNVISDTTIAGNTMTNIGLVGVSSYWCTEWHRNVVQGNSVSGAPRLIWLTYETATNKCGTAQGLPILADNKFIGNSLRNATNGTLGPLGSRPGILVSFAGDVSNNLIQNNDVGPLDCPSLDPIAGFVDGGGNLCRATNAGALGFTGLQRPRALRPAPRPAPPASRPPGRRD